MPHDLAVHAASADSVDAALRLSKFHGEPEILTAVQLLEKRNFCKADSWTAILEKEVSRRNTVLLTATYSSKVVGYIVYTTNKLKVHVSKVAVDQPFRRRGIARKLVQACLELARQERSVDAATLHVDPANAAARSLYQSLGFEIDGVLEDYYAPGRPAWRLMLARIG